MRKDIIGWAILAFTFLIPFRYVYFHIDDQDMANGMKALYFLITLVGLGIGYNIIGKYKDKNKTSHH